MNILITGGAGFIGSNAVYRFCKQGWKVSVLDDLSRCGATLNLKWLEKAGTPFRFFQIDISDAAAVQKHFDEYTYTVVFHLAGQVAVTTSILDPRRDFEVNASGTFNLLEAIRTSNPETILIYSSTNKVYGKLSQIEVIEAETRYTFSDDIAGVSESIPVDYYSPYGCSKGIADQYCIDYHRIYGLRTVTLRQSCIFGERQFGIEDQGWVAWFMIAHLTGKPITIYGNGKQVRDLLYVDDLIDSYFAVIDRIDSVAGAAFNIGGGSDHALSLLEFIDILNSISPTPLTCSHDDWRPGDQPIYISSIEKAAKDLGWVPETGVRSAIENLYHWVKKRIRSFFSRWLIRPLLSSPG